MSAQKSALFVSALLCIAALSSSAWALTAEDVLDRMDDSEANAYLAGSVEMAAFLSYVQGNSERSDCIMDWYYTDGGVERIVAALSRFKDRQAQPIVYTLIKRACGE